MSLRNKLLSAALVSFSLAACGGETEETPVVVDPQKQALLDVKAYVAGHLDKLVDASEKLAAAAPAPDADGWNATSDAAAVAEMKKQWLAARDAYEHVEGAIAVLFPDLDVSTDERYDGFLEGANPDENLFDAEGVTGIHAIERILWSNVIPQAVIDFEKALPGNVYRPAAFPTSSAQATDFKTKLAARLVTDVKKMRDEFKPLALDPAAAYRGVIGSMAEQIEKVQKAGEGAEESRYAQATLRDMRSNVEAGLETAKLFGKWLESKGGTAEQASVIAGFTRVQAAYAGVTGDAIPPVPTGWKNEAPETNTAEAKASAFGKLFITLHTEADDKATSSLVAAMNAGAKKMAIADLPAE